MTDFSVKEVLEALEATSDPGDQFEWGYYDKWDSGTRTRSPLTIVLRGSPYEVSEVHSTGGEGEGENACTVISVGTQFFRKSGYYASHYGYDWDGEFEEVFPVVDLVTSYERTRPDQHASPTTEVVGNVADGAPILEAGPDRRIAALAILDELHSAIAADMGKHQAPPEEQDVAPALSRIRSQIDVLTGVLQALLRD